MSRAALGNWLSTLLIVRVTPFGPTGGSGRPLAHTRAPPDARVILSPIGRQFVAAARPLVAGSAGVIPSDIPDTSDTRATPLIVV